MTRIAELLDKGPTFSVEFFPPKTEQGVAKLHSTVDALEALSGPTGLAQELSFVSITYGAGGSTRDRTRDLVVEVNSTRRFPAMPHLTCMGHTRGEIDSLLGDYASSGVHNVLALAGDPPLDGSEPSGDFTYATELIEAVRTAGDFSVGVAAHPECHPRSPDRASDRKYLAEKLNAADFGITQFFFDAGDYFRMVEELRDLGCETPVIPGVMPLLNPTTVQRFAGIAGARFPEELAARVSAHREEDARLAEAAGAAAELAGELIDGGVPGIHIYCMNRADIVTAIVSRLT